jgi:hypothetical protein
VQAVSSGDSQQAEIWGLSERRSGEKPVNVFAKHAPNESNQVTLNGYSNAIIANLNTIKNSLFNAFQFFKFGNILNGLGVLHDQYSLFDFRFYSLVGYLFEVTEKRFPNVYIHFRRYSKTSSILTLSLSELYDSSKIAKKTASSNSSSVYIRFAGTCTRLGERGLFDGFTIVVSMLKYFIWAVKIGEKQVKNYQNEKINYICST